MLEFLLLVNKLGQTRLSHYYSDAAKRIRGRVEFEAELVRTCLSRADDECSSLYHDGRKIIYRRYASLYFIAGVDEAETNELAILEFIHCLVETFDRHFENVCELDIMFNMEKAHYILDEMISVGCITDTSKTSVLSGMD